MERVEAFLGQLGEVPAGLPFTGLDICDCEFAVVSFAELLFEAAKAAGAMAVAEARAATKIMFLVM